RYDHSGPVGPRVLEWFLSHTKESADFELYLVPDGFHPKIIWWKGAGVYIGSANLSKHAWGGNVEAGLYLSEEELSEHDLAEKMQTFFADLRDIAHPLTQELKEEMTQLATGNHAQALERARKRFEETRRLPRRPSLIEVTRRPAKLKQKGAFLREWADTLQILRAIGGRLAQPTNRPCWLPKDVPSGVLADQFLQAFYYNKVRDGVSYPYREMFETNKDSREAALQHAIEWWRNLPAAPSREDLHISSWAPQAKRLLARESIHGMSVEAFEELCLLVYAVRDHAKRVSSTTLGLLQGLAGMAQDERIRKFAAWLHGQSSSDGSSTCQVIEYVLYGGVNSETAYRLFEACFGSKKKVPHLGVSSLGEMIGWAMPDEFPPRNGRTNKALTALGFQVTIHSE
ncbi:MAG: phosphatidylserine/phosphatidylglycerophosphate/cardiolipin synthase family protein, partial [Verrucomicrobiae bacterium]|nr:phosphatidylserine/phosphatidylglycerophosphate/cardiolipin synthase family protein [Verrucomicrobiae bacterium]